MLRSLGIVHETRSRNSFTKLGIVHDSLTFHFYPGRPGHYFLLVGRRRTPTRRSPRRARFIAPRSVAHAACAARARAGAAHGSSRREALHAPSRAGGAHGSSRRTDLDAPIGPRRTTPNTACQPHRRRVAPGSATCAVLSRCHLRRIANFLPKMDSPPVPSACVKSPPPVERAHPAKNEHIRGRRPWHMNSVITRWKTDPESGLPLTALTPCRVETQHGKEGARRVMHRR